MNDKQQRLIEFIQNNPECVENLTEALVGKKEKELKVWEPSPMDWAVDQYGDVIQGVHYITDRHMLGLMGPTREFVEQTRDYLKVITKLRLQTKGFVPDWENDNQRKFTFQYDCIDRKFNIFNYLWSNPGFVYFATEKDTQAAADSLTPEEIETFKKGWPVYPMVEEK